MFVPADPELNNWVEIEIEIEATYKCYEKGLLKIYEISRTPKYPKTLSFVSFKELYNEIREITRWMVFEAKYSKNQIINEICAVYGIHPEYSEIFVNEVLDELGAVEIDGIVEFREL